MTLLRRIKKFLFRNVDKTNLYHPDFDDKIETAFSSRGKQYYRFTRETIMPWGRYMIMQDYIAAQTLRINPVLLKKYMENLTKVLNGNKGVIELGNAFKIIGQIQSRLELAFETETTLRLASVIFFDDTEDLYLYNKAYNDQKIAAWKEDKCVDFFYMMPMSELLGLKDSSPADLRIFMALQKGITEDLNYETQEQ
jgi:hypothetical protein